MLKSNKKTSFDESLKSFFSFSQKFDKSEV